MNASIFSAVNENSASLVQVKVDISLFKCEPLPEFRPVGLALTKQRKDEAENGKIHETAAKLGRLFNDLIPNTPSLLRAYGHRASEIISSSDINPLGTDADGPFKEYIGADARSIWAAATSGPSAISVHLLGCMLAKAWSSSEATGIWVELIRERKTQMTETMNSRGQIYQELVEASHQDIERTELANWDSSMRAWLRRAQETKRSQHCQFSLISENIKLPWTTPGTTYQKVTQSWIKAMKVMEDLLNNLPQEANDRALLHAIASWHLYPDLLVFGDNGAVNVRLNDPLLPVSAVLSLGLEYNGQNSQKATSWSLALSQLRYYGTVRVTSEQNQARLAMSQVWLVALGNILRQWNIGSSSIEETIIWFRQLGDTLRKHKRSRSKTLTWLWRITDCCRSLLDQDELGRRHGLSVIRYGFRRATGLIDNNPGFSLPFFGLCHPSAMMAIPQNGDIDRGIEYLRSVCTSINLQGYNTLLSYSQNLSGKVRYNEWTTIQSCRWDHHSNSQAPAYLRWISLSQKSLTSDGRQVLERRKLDIEERGETCYIVHDLAEKPSDEFKDGSQHLVWKLAPGIFADDSGSAHFTSVFSSIGSQLSTGTSESAGFQVWAKNSVAAPCSPSLTADLNAAMRRLGDISQGTSWLQSLTATRHLLDYLFNALQASKEISTTLEPRSSTNGDATEDTVLRLDNQRTMSYEMIGIMQHPSLEYIYSLRVLELATHIYAQLPNATISPRIVDLKLKKARWVSEPLQHALDNRLLHELIYQPTEYWAEKLTRAQVFGCIAMFESGRFNVDPEHLDQVVALGAEDSLFVADILLSDPVSQNSAPKVHHLIGNVGHSGMVLLVAPLDPLLRETGYDPFSVQHRPFNGKRFDALRSTSLHLSFTEWKYPIDGGETGKIDQEIFLLESVLSVRHGGRWVGDIDVLSFERSQDCIFISPASCECVEKNHSVLGDVVSITSWDELLDPPATIGVIHGNGNWPARLAAVSILSQLGKSHCIAIIQGDPMCWGCFRRKYAYPELHIPEFIID